MKKLLVSLIVLAFVGSASAELISGGSFEYYAPTFFLYSHSQTSMFIAGAMGASDWHVNKSGLYGGVILLPDGWTGTPVSDGYWNLHIADGGSDASVTQNITTAIGQQYQLSFWHEDFGNDQPAQMRVTIGDADGTGTEYLDQTWTNSNPAYLSATFTATATNSIIEFDNAAFGNTIDEVSIVSLAPPGYVGGIAPDSLSIDDPAGTGAGTSDTYTITLTDDLTGSAQFRVFLDPCDLWAGGLQQATVSPAKAGDPNTALDILFTSANWDTPVTVTVTAVDDVVGELPLDLTLTHTLVHVSGAVDPCDANWVLPFLENNVVSVAVSDGDQIYAIEIDEIDPCGIEVSEQGPTSNIYTVVVKKQPTTSVEVVITTDEDVTVDPCTVTFDNVTWNTPQTVTVTAVDDAVGEDDPHVGDISHSIPLPGFTWSGTAAFSDDFENNDPCTPYWWTKAPGGGQEPNLVEGASAYGNGGVLKTTQWLYALAPTDLPSFYKAVINVDERDPETLRDTNIWHIMVRSDPCAVPSGLVVELCTDCSKDFRIFDATSGWTELGGGDFPDWDPCAVYTITITDELTQVTIRAEEVGDPANYVEFTATGVGSISSGEKLMMGGWDGDAGETAIVEWLDVNIFYPTTPPAQEELDWANAQILYASGDGDAVVADNDCMPERVTLIGDVDGDCDADLADFALFAEDYMDCTLPNVPGCL